MADCKMLFMSGSKTARLKKTLLSITTSLALTVSTLSDYSQVSGMMSLNHLNPHLRFSVAQKTGLNLNSQILPMRL